MFSSPAIIRSNVDLPQPEGPTSTTNSPLRIETSTPWITAVAPKAFRTSRIATEAIHSSRGRARPVVFFILRSAADAWNIRAGQIIGLSPSEKQALVTEGEQKNRRKSRTIRPGHHRPDGVGR